MDTTLVTALASTSSAAIGALAAYAAGARQARANLKAVRLQFDAQVELAGRQFHVETANESRRARQQKLEDSYVELAAWLHDLDVAVDEIWDLVCSDQDDAWDRLYKICGDWPFTILVPPKSAALARCFWSATVNDLIADFSRISGDFVRNSIGSRMSYTSGPTAIPMSLDEEKKSRQRSKDGTWDARGKLLEITAKIRDRIRDEILAAYETAEATRPVE